jgi:hypothetical protein
VHRVPRPGCDVIARADLVERFGRILATRTLTEWAAHHPARQRREGRAPTWVVPITDDVTMVVRHAWHGGILAPITRDLWRAPGRAAHEAEVSDRLRAAGVPTPEVLAWTIETAFPGLVRIDVCTTFVPDARDLPTLFADATPQEAQHVVPSVAALVESLSASHAVHADLNIKNILVDTSGIAHVLDVDRVTFMKGSPSVARRANWDRLLRSAAKWQRLHGDRVPLHALRSAAQAPAAMALSTGALA